MDPARRSSVISLAHRVRAAWVVEPPPPEPDLASLLRGVPPADAVEAVVADAEERWDRGLPATLDHYLAALPAELDSPALRRALLMCEVARRDDDPIEAVRADLIARRVAEPDVEAVLALAALTRSAVAGLEAADAELNAGQTVGPYRLMSPLGSGAFGEVWMALDTELQRHVALKLLYAPVDEADASAARLITEARAAAALDHENIVAVHRAGVLRADADRAESARFFIDSQLAGDPAPTRDDPLRVAPARSLEEERRDPTSACSSPRVAAGIVEAIARAVAAAHARGILHRDLKPSNILITPSGRPMVADFGLCATDAFRADDNGDDAARSGIVGTPVFMSPEQARGQSATPLTDVFALGAVLRFLLTGDPPYSPSGRHSPDARQDVLEQARCGGPSPLRGHRGVSPTLGAIADRAMAADPRDRYSSADQMAADLRAFLTHRPTLARPRSPLAALGLWYRRHAVPATIAAVAAVVITGGTVRFVQRLEDERNRALAAETVANLRRIEAEEARDVAAASNRFMSEALLAAAPGQPGVARDPRISDVLESASARAATLADEPLVEANARALIGHVYMTLSRPAEARPHLVRALEIRRRLLPPEHLDVLESRRLVAQVDHNTGRTRRAREALIELAEIDKRVLGPDHRETLTVLDTLGTLYGLNMQYAEAEACQIEVLESRLRTLGPDHINTLGARRALATTYLRSGKQGEGIAMLREALAALKRRNDLKDGYYIAFTTQDLAAALRDAGQPDEAEPLFHEAIKGLAAVVGPDHQSVLMGEHNLGMLLLVDRHDAAGALPLLRHAADTSARVTSPDNRITIIFRQTLGRCLLTLGERDEAFEVLVAAHDSAYRTLGAEHEQTRNLEKLLNYASTAPAEHGR